ncbi:hypothetical protein V6x_38250 [Gimesia chilikensis]|uniref:Uncharacterized protein n=1 Tax=Gimesia chilikensis TaxID=2605989 RepID=A0A517WFR7_9PLAN|nr:hypothetical protein [Gimesia chilikensis]QDU04100.1 hypothetical protein V6x_38250 [Gimesia chilikensis]
MTDRPVEIQDISPISKIERVIRPPKTFRTEGITNLIFFSVIFSGFGYAMWLSAPPDRGVYAWLLAGVFWLLMAFISIWSILIWKYVAVTFHQGYLSLRSIYSRRELKLSEIKVVHWSLFSHGQIKVKNDTTSGRINLYYFSNKDRLWLIQYFRDRYPHQIQENWPLFCLKIALPLRNKLSDKPCKPHPDDVLHTRQDWDRLLVRMTLIAAIIGILSAWYFSRPGFLLFPLVSIACWFFRFSTPREGEYVPSVSADRDFINTWKFLLWWSLAWLAIWIPFWLDLLSAPFSPGFGSTIAAFWTAGLYGRVILMYRRESQKDLEKTTEAVKEWESGSAKLLPHDHEGATR